MMKVYSTVYGRRQSPVFLLHVYMLLYVCVSSPRDLLDFAQSAFIALSTTITIQLN